MLIIPFDRPLEWRRLPLATLLLVLVNAVVYFTLQLDDNARLGEAVEYYYSAGLAETELPLYRDHLLAEGEAAFVREWEDKLDEPNSPWLFRMLGDGPFMDRLRGGALVTPADAGHQRWQERRARFEALLSENTVWASGLKPARAEPATFLSHMFLHGGLMHLLGNMFFLVAVGFLVEMTLGAAAFTGLYLLGGLGAAGLYLALNLDSAVPMVGASGAIAGLMGMYAVIYGLRRINFFYWVLVYFDYVKAPAIVLLPLWLGNELFQYFSAGKANSVAYMAHVGGLLTGAGLAFGYKHFGPGVDEDYIGEKERREAYETDLETVETALRALAPERARAALARLQAGHPDDPRVLSARYQAARFQPDGDAFHQAARDILERGDQRAVPRELWLWAYADYLKRAKPKPRLSRTLVVVAARRLLDYEDTVQAARLLGIMTAHPQRFPEAAEYLLRLANVRLRHGEARAAAADYQRLRRLFPDSQEAHLAGQRLAELSR